MRCCAGQACAGDGKIGLLFEIVNPASKAVSDEAHSVRKRGATAPARLNLYPAFTERRITFARSNGQRHSASEVWTGLTRLAKTGAIKVNPQGLPRVYRTRNQVRRSDERNPSIVNGLIGFLAPQNSGGRKPGGRRAVLHAPRLLHPQPGPDPDRKKFHCAFRMGRRLRPRILHGSS